MFSTDTNAKSAPVYRIGNLTEDPQLRSGKERGTPYVRFGLAVNEPVTPGDWAGKRTTIFYDVTAFRSLAEGICNSLDKGSPVIVVGREEVEHHTTEAGEKKVRRRIIADAAGPDLRWSSVTVTKRRPRRRAS